MHTIPKIIHQTWKTDEMPFPFTVLAETWRTFLPEWQYILWTDEMNRNFIATEFPDFLDAFDNYSSNIQRADAIRYFILKKYGGLYVDMDFECLENIEPLLEDAVFVAGKEPQLHAERYGLDYIICNAFMASTPENDFIRFICEKVVELAPGKASSAMDVLKKTGPLMLTEAYDAFSCKEGIRIYEPEYLYPIRIFEKDKILNDMIPEEMQERINKAYAIHYFWGNW